MIIPADPAPLVRLSGCSAVRDNKGTSSVSVGRTGTRTASISKRMIRIAQKTQFYLTKIHL